MGSGDIRRSMTGDWINQFYGRARRADVQGEKGFRPMAAMKLYMSGNGNNRNDPRDLADFENLLDDLEAKYTNYGCYCWINGVDAGVLGGGKTKDVTDHHCKELYRWYKCVNNDYAKNYTDVSYTVDFTMKNGERVLDCSGKFDYTLEISFENTVSKSLIKTEKQKSCLVRITRPYNF